MIESGPADYFLPVDLSLSGFETERARNIIGMHARAAARAKRLNLPFARICFAVFSFNILSQSQLFAIFSVKRVSHCSVPKAAFPGILPQKHETK
jgi:hypothetical protein